MTSYTTNALQDSMMQYGDPSHMGDVTSNSDNGEVPVGFSAEEETEHHHLHPDSRVLFEKCPWVRKVPVFGQACEAYGPKCTLSLGFCYLLCKGIADQVISYARYPMFRERFGIGAIRYQRLANISTMGWSIKALTAALCDTFAFLGYTKRWYMFVSCVLGGVFAIIFASLPPKPSSADTGAAFVFLTSFGKANVDILSEGHYSRLMKKIPKAGPALVSWIWWFIMIGAVVAAGMQGPLSDQGKMQVGVYISAALQIVTCVIFLFNWYGERVNRVERLEDARLIHTELLEERARLGLDPDNVEGDLVVAPEKDMHPENFSWDGDATGATPGSANALGDELVLDSNESAHNQAAAAELAAAELAAEPIPGCCGLFEMNKEVATRNWRIFVYSGVMTCAVIAMTCGNILADKLGLLIICIVVSLACCGTSFWALPLVISKANIFGYLQMVVYLQLPGAVDSFYLATEDCISDGPHFSYTFYNTIGAVIGNVAGLAGVTAFNYIFSQHSYRLTFIITTTVQIIASIFDIVMVKRWNLYIGIPDHAMYICGDAIVYQVCYMLAWMPMVVLLSRLCPRGSESVVYALMAGFANLGQTTSSAIGAILMEYVWPVYADPKERPCDFSNVPLLLLVGHILLPLLVIPLTLLLPSARICDDLDVNGKAIKKELKGKDTAAAAAAAAPTTAMIGAEPEGVLPGDDGLATEKARRE